MRTKSASVTSSPGCLKTPLAQAERRCHEEFVTTDRVSRDRFFRREPLIEIKGWSVICMVNSRAAPRAARTA